jgi:hypothetical protein
MLLPLESTDPEERALFSRVAQWPSDCSYTDMNADRLQEIAHREGIDFATALLFGRIMSSPQHGPFIEQIRQLKQQNLQNRQPVNVTLAVVPGAFYVEYPETGADGQVVRQIATEFGYCTELIPVHSVGTPLQNSKVICDWLAERSELNIVLVSLSKGGADVKIALAASGGRDLFRNVVAWINFGGILDGSPAAEWLLSRRMSSLLLRCLFLFRGYDFRFILDLGRGSGNLLDFELQSPEHLKMIHVVAFPLIRHLSSRRARRWHRRLSSLGPNDAVMMLADVCKLPGLILPVWGTDHYIQSGWDARRLVAAMLLYLSDELKLSENLRGN